MAARGDDLSRLLAAAGLEGSELLGQEDEKLRAAVEQRRAWLESTSVLTDDEKRALADGAATWRSTIGQCLADLASKTRIVADIAAEADPTERPDVWAALAAELEAVASRARAQAAIITLTRAIDRRLADGEEE